MLIKSMARTAGKPQGFWGFLQMLKMNHGHQKLHAFSLDCTKIGPAFKILDVGVGGGAQLKRLLKAVPQGTVTGIDISADAVAFTKKCYAEDLGKRLTLELGDVRNLKYADGTFDLVTAFETVYYWGDLKTAFAEVRRVLKKSGVFLFAVEMIDYSKDWEELVPGLKLYTEGEYAKALEQAGFDDIHSYQMPSSPALCFTARA